MLQFSPRCLVAKNGWICCGGEKGEYAAMQVDSEGTDESLDLDPDARLPLDLDMSRGEESIFSVLARSRPVKSVVAKTKTFGKERVNCITLWFPPTQVTAALEAYQVPVAVLANNDKHVTVVGLRNTEALDELTYPDFVNRAILSPDGRLLVAVSDDPYLYVHRRAEKERSGSHALRSSDQPEYEWVACSRVWLKSQRHGDQSYERGSFAACFSNSGKLLAVGTQYGLISVFDTDALANSEEALVTWFHTSKPGHQNGAVRDMSFCPGPFDLLAWTEDRGSVGIADVRASFISRQILKLGPEDSYENVPLTERVAIDPRLLERHTDVADNLSSRMPTLIDTLDTSSEARRNRSRDMLRNYHLPFTAGEPRDAAGGEDAAEQARAERMARNAAASRRFRDRAARRGGEQSVRPASDRNAVQDSSSAIQPESLGPRTSPWAVTTSIEAPNLGIPTGIRVPRDQLQLLQQRFYTASQLEHQQARERSASVSRAVNDILGNIQTQRDRIRDATERLQRDQARQMERLRVREQLGNELRRTHARASETPPGEAEARTGGTSSSGTVARTSGLRTSLSGWENLEALYNITFDGNATSSATAAERDEAARRAEEELDSARRDRTAFVNSLMNAQTQRDLIGGSGVGGIEDVANFLRRNERETREPDHTAGLAWSEDGRIL